MAKNNADRQKEYHERKPKRVSNALRKNMLDKRKTTQK